jgi:hypothetical protein
MTSKPRMPGIEDTPSGQPIPVVTDADIVERGRQVIAATQNAWVQPDISDSTSASLGITGEAAEKLANGGLTHAEFARARAQSSAAVSNAPAHTGNAR